MLPYFYLGKHSFENEVLFESDIRELLGVDIENVKIRDCCIYDISGQTMESPEKIEQTMLFTLEFFCDVRLKQQDVRTIAKKINCEKKLLIPQKFIKAQLHAETGNHCVILHMSNVAFCSHVIKNRGVVLTVTANIDAIILDEPHEDFIICSQINIVPPEGDEVQDWKQLLNSINIKDTVSLFENLLNLVKSVNSDNSNDFSESVKIKLEQENMKLTNEIYELRNRIRDLKNEISNQGYIINGLLKIIKPL